jgi:hypothetical protein
VHPLDSPGGRGIDRTARTADADFHGLPRPERDRAAPRSEFTERARFRELLRPQVPGRLESVDPGSELASLVPAFAAPAWTRPEGPRLEGEARPAAPANQPLSPAATDRLLVGRGPAGAEARLSINEGLLAGTEIHLRVGPGGVHATVLTGPASSRQTLAAAMEEVARRLRARGRTLTVGWAGSNPDGARADAERSAKSKSK